MIAYVPLHTHRASDTLHPDAAEHTQRRSANVDRGNNKNTQDSSFFEKWASVSLPETNAVS